MTQEFDTERVHLDRSHTTKIVRVKFSALVEGLLMHVDIVHELGHIARTNLVDLFLENFGITSQVLEVLAIGRDKVIAKSCVLTHIGLSSGIFLGNAGGVLL